MRHVSAAEAVPFEPIKIAKDSQDDLKIHRISDSPIEITVQYDDRQFSEFVSMSIEEKNKCAENCRNILSEFRAFFEELIEDIDEIENRVEVEATSQKSP